MVYHEYKILLCRFDVHFVQFNVKIVEAKANSSNRKNRVLFRLENSFRLMYDQICPKRLISHLFVFL